MLALGGIAAEGVAAATTPVVVRLVARTVRPGADMPWPYCVIAVTKATVEPVEVSIKQRLFDERGNPIGDVATASFYGAWCNTVKFPGKIRNLPITLETKVTVQGRELRIRTAIRVK